MLVLVVELALLTSMPALLLVAMCNGQFAVCTIYSENWFVMQSAICTVQHNELQSAAQSNVQCNPVCVCTVSVHLTNRRHLGLVTVAPPWWPPLVVVGLATAGQSESHTGPLIPSTLCLLDSI